MEWKWRRFINIGVPLYEAASIGDWKAAKPILDQWPDLVQFAVTENLETLLHVAASADRRKAVEEFVVNLLNLMEREDLELQNKSGDTAFSLAAQSGNIETAKAMLNKHRGLIDIPNKKGMMPLYMALLFAKAEMARYLYDLSYQMRGDYWNNRNRGWVLLKCVESEIFDVAIKIVKDRPELTDNKWLLTDVLLALAQNNDALEGKSTNVGFRNIKSC
ncbi:uncharacterized protein LOC143581483 [Bidens hawaiensis]|uniref:uncharacterized protein LOC143581483 n=1 Tax=Bidens hawaiensis TaxID=980011 RepID=UPI00404A3612